MKTPAKLLRRANTTLQLSVSAVVVPVVLPSLPYANSLTHTRRDAQTSLHRSRPWPIRFCLSQRRHLNTTTGSRGPALTAGYKNSDAGTSAPQDRAPTSNQESSKSGQGSAQGQTRRPYDPNTRPGAVSPILFRQKSRAKPTPERRGDTRDGLSAKEMMRNFKLDGQGRDNQPRAYSLSNMQLPGSSGASKRDPTSLLGADAQQFDIESLAPTFRISPALGKTVAVDQNRNMDLGRAFKTIEIRCATNRLRKDLQAQRYHERPGLKRKRLKMERWAGRFKADFVKTVRRVEQLRRMGW